MPTTYEYEFVRIGESKGSAWFGVRDRDRNAYEAIVHAQGPKAPDALSAIRASYNEKVTDEFVHPTVITQGDGSPVGRIRDGDVAMFFNFRADRAREMTRALAYQDFKEFDRALGDIQVSNQYVVAAVRSLAQRAPGGVADARRQPGHTLAVNGAVGDESHGPGHHVTPHVPFRRPRRGVGPTAFAGPESGLLCGRGRRIKPHVAGERRADRAAGPAIDLRGQHSRDEPAVEPGVLGLDGPIAAVEIFVHASTITRAHRHHWRKIDIVVGWAMTLATCRFGKSVSHSHLRCHSMSWGYRNEAGQGVLEALRAGHVDACTRLRSVPFPTRSAKGVGNSGGFAAGIDGDHD